MLAAQGIIASRTSADIERGMAQIRAEIESGAFEWKLDLEDVHLNIEARLTQLVGDAGKRLHTGRSRNDQVTTDVRLWLRGEIDLIAGPAASRCRSALVDIAEKNVDVILPGFTHLQVAQPVSFGHHMLAYVEMFSRDAERLHDVRKRVNRLPLGAAALAGTSYPLDRELVAKTLNMDGVCQNSLDAVSDRDFAIEFTRRRQPVHGAHQPRERGADPVDEPELRLHPDRRPLHAPARRSCRRRRTPTCPSWRAARPAAWSAT